MRRTPQRSGRLDGIENGAGALLTQPDALVIVDDQFGKLGGARFKRIQIGRILDAQPVEHRLEH